MKYFNEHRRRLIKAHSVIGTRAKASCAGSELNLSAASGGGFEKIEILGKTYQTEIPTPTRPSSLQNTGNDMLEVSIKGYNLFNEELMLESSNIKKADVGYEVNEYFNSFSSNNFLVKHLKAVIKPNVTYTLCNNVISRNSASAGSIVFRSSSAHLVALTDYTLGKHTVTFSLTQEEVDSLIGVWIYGTGSSALEKGKNKTVMQIMLLEGEYTVDNLPPFEPYVQPQTVSVGLQLCGIDDYKDKLTVDLVNKTVTKHSAIELYTFTGYESIYEETDGNNNKAYIVDLPSEKAPETKYYCTHFSVYDGNYTAFEDIVEIIDNKAWFYNPTVDLVALLKTGEVQIAYVKNYPDSENVTDTARELFKLTTPYRQAAVLEAEGAYSIEATYYSYENEDKLSLTVHYKSEDKRSLKDSNTYSIREGSRYTVIAPEIDGYEPLATHYEGYLTEDDEITITYKEKK